MTRPYVIYGLTDPRTDQVRYIGWTQTPQQRLRAHISEAKRQRSHKARWIASLLKIGLSPGLFAIAEVDGGWAEAERFWIAFYQAFGCPLTNMADGGEGAPGHMLSAESRKKISRAGMGRHPSAETCARLSAANKGRNLTPEHKEKISMATRGRARCKPSTETRAKMAAAHKGRKSSLETRAKMSAYQRGSKRAPRSDEAKQKAADANRGRKRSVKSREKMSEWQRGRKLTPEHRAKLSASHTSLKHPAEQNARHSQAMREWWMSRKAAA